MTGDGLSSNIDGGQRPIMRRIIGGLARWLAGVSVGVALPFALSLGVSLLASDPRFQQRYRVTAERLEVDLPAGYTLPDLLAEVGLNGTLDLTDPRTPQQIAHALAGHGAVAAVERVAVLPGWRVRAWLTLREPVLVCAWDHRCVDRDGTLLPARVHREGLLTLVTRPERDGDPLLREAARLADTLRAGPAWLHGSKLERTGEGWSIWARPGFRLRFGSAPGDEWPGETPTARKLEFLHAMPTPQGPFSPADYRELDLRRLP
jgi:sulfur carrier protein ThiS